MINHEKAFVKLFSQTARYHHRFKVFEDFISCSVIALENRLHFSEVREQKYLRIVGGYEKEDVTRMAQLLAHVINGLGDASGDFLGRVFMQLELGDKYRGQFFTPWDVARMMAAMQLGDTEALFRDKREKRGGHRTGICGSPRQISIRLRPVWLTYSCPCAGLPAKWW